LNWTLILLFYNHKKFIKNFKTLKISFVEEYSKNNIFSLQFYYSKFSMEFPLLIFSLVDFFKATSLQLLYFRWNTTHIWASKFNPMVLSFKTLLSNPGARPFEIKIWIHNLHSFSWTATHSKIKTSNLNLVLKQRKNLSWSRYTQKLQILGTYPPWHPICLNWPY